MPQLFGFDKVAIRGPKPAPIVGMFASLYELLEDPIAIVMRLRHQGDVVALMDQNPAVVCVFGPERNREVLAQPGMFKNDETLFKGPPGSGMDKVKNAVIVINGDTHKRHRKLLQPPFHKNMVDGYAKDIVSTTRIMLDRWKIGEVDAIDSLCRDLAMAVDMKCLYGLDVGDEAHELGHMAAEWIKYITDPMSILMPFNIPGLGFHKAVKFGDRVIGRIQALIERKRKMGGEQRDAMAMLMNAHDDETAPFTEDELVAEATTLFIAGHETLAMTLTWTLFLLERHPAIHAALMAEINSALGDRDPTSEDIPNMALLDRVIKESMRMLPTVPLLFMRVCADTSTVGGYTVPQNSNIVVSPLATHHDPTLYPEPKRFNPDRWLDSTPTPYGYLPYSIGPRNCVGMPFADRALRLMLPMVLKRFRFSISAGTKIDRLTRANILQPRQHIPVLIESATSKKQQLTQVEGNIFELLDY